MLKIRRAVPADCGKIARIQVRGWQAAYRGILPDDYLDGLDAGRRLVVWQQFVLDGVGTMLVAEVGAEVVGFCHLIPSRDSDADHAAEIAAIYIDPDHLRRGHGTLLCKAACVSAREQDFRRLTLWVLRDNASGRDFYTKMGLLPDGTTKVEERPGFTLEEVRYSMELR
ncbi:MAG: GNAT family N-acetyltransferase [Luteolibacter sp.]|uniref:GNAT family N-acetyltransferase n=1 Tax=Luteolibacter sp. TaxID=1962973 RepID=UPI003266D154